MAYTQSDLDSVRAARVKLAAGERVVRVTVGTTTTEYQQANVEDLRLLERQIAGEVAAAAGGARHVVVSSSKGL